MNRKSRVKRAARLLGASRVVPVGRVDHTPLGLAALTDRVRRLRSTGPGGTGRPSDPGATLPRIVKFRPRTWKRLRRVAESQARRTGVRVSPAQIASMLLEEVLEKDTPRQKRAQ